MCAHFAPHGDTRLDIVGQVLLVRPQGPGNEEEVKRVLGRVNEMLGCFGGIAWAAIIFEQGDYLLTPSAEQMLVAAVPALLASGLRAVALVFGGEGGNILYGQFSRIFDQTPCRVSLFTSEQSARDWLTAVAAV